MFTIEVAGLSNTALDRPAVCSCIFGTKLLKFHAAYGYMITTG